MRLDDIIRKLHTELRYMQSQFQAYDDRILSPIVRAKRTCESLMDQRSNGATLAEADAEECLSGIRMDLERIAHHGVIRNDLLQMVEAAGRRFMRWEA